MKTIAFDLHVRIPAYTPPDDALFFAGAANNWQPDQPEFRFQRQKDGSWHLRVEAATDDLHFKITRGTWDKAEADAVGSPAPDRRLRAQNSKYAHWLTVPAWTDLRLPARQHTVAENVVLLHPRFFIPELGRYRRVWAYLPPDYHFSTRHYPVLYMQDGQNLFDAYGSFSGEWAVDKALNRLFQSGDNPMSTCIVIGIENGGPHRNSEYAPWPHPEHRSSEGGKYLDFLCHTLKPFIDGTLRTLPGRAHTGIMGSSMGGLISLHAALKRPDVFGMAGIFSPSLWFSKEIFALAKEKRPAPQPKILLMAGQRESKTMVSDLLDLYEDLLEAGHPAAQLHYDLHADGEHAEWFWAREFEHALQWLLGDDVSEPHGHAHDGAVEFDVQKKTKTLLVSLKQPLPEPVLEIRDYCHGRRFLHPLRADALNHISYREWENCIYSVRLLTAGDLVFSRRVTL